MLNISKIVIIIECRFCIINRFHDLSQKDFIKEFRAWNAGLVINIVLTQPFMILLEIF